MCCLDELQKGSNTSIDGNVYLNLHKKNKVLVNQYKIANSVRFGQSSVEAEFSMDRFGFG